MAMIIDGKAVSAQIREEIKEDVIAFTKKHGAAPSLTVIIVGEDPASQVYVRNKHKACGEVGMYSREELEKVTGSKIFLDLWVRVKENWREREGLVSNFGYNKKDID